MEEDKSTLFSTSVLVSTNDVIFVMEVGWINIPEDGLLIGVPPQPTILNTGEAVVVLP